MSRNAQKTRVGLGQAGIQVPWKPNGTRWGSSTVATGPDPMSVASSTARWLASVACSYTNVSNHPSPSPADSESGTKKGSVGWSSGPESQRVSVPDETS